LIAAADEAELAADPFLGLSDWLQAFARYAETKRVLLSEMQQAFEHNPDLRVQIRERMLDAAARVLEPAKASGAVRADVMPGDLIQLVGGMCMSAIATPEQNQRLLTVILGGLRAD